VNWVTNKDNFKKIKKNCLNFSDKLFWESQISREIIKNSDKRCGAKSSILDIPCYIPKIIGLLKLTGKKN
jgi:hypothetical protein